MGVSYDTLNGCGMISEIHWQFATQIERGRGWAKKEGRAEFF